MDGRKAQDIYLLYGPFQKKFADLCTTLEKPLVQRSANF